MPGHGLGEIILRVETPVADLSAGLAFCVEESSEGPQTGEDMDIQAIEKPEQTEESQAWRRFYDDLDLRIVGTLSKGSGARLSLAVVSAQGSDLYAFVRESADGHLEDCTQLDDA